MAKVKGKVTKNQLSEKDYDDLVKKADWATSTLYPLRLRARNLREDIGEVDDTIADLEKDVRNYVEDIGSQGAEKREKLRLFLESTQKKIAKVEADTKKRLKEIEEEKEEVENERAQAQEQAQLLRVKLGELERNILLEASQKQKITELNDFFAQIKIEHDQVLKDLKAEFTRDLRKMRKDYDEKMNVTNNDAKNLLKPCITEIVNSIRDANTSLAHYMHRISQKQGVLFQKTSQVEWEKNHLRYEYELWKDIQARKLFRCDPHLSIASNHSLELDTSTYVESLPRIDIVASVDKIMKVTPYEELKNTLRSLLGSRDTSTESDTSTEPESPKEGSFDEIGNIEP